MLNVRKLSFFLSCVIVLSSAVLARASDLKPEDVIAKHLDSIATSETRSAIKSRAIQGPAVFKVIVGGGGMLEGKGGLVSESRKSNLVLRFNSEYRGEQIVSNGDKAYVAASMANHRRSDFGELIHTQDFLVREGLLGGALSTNWALLNLDKLQAKVDYKGVKKFDGSQVLDLQYHSKKHDDMNVHIYLDPESYRHIATVYTISLSSNLAGQGALSAAEQTGLSQSVDRPGADVTQSARQREIRYTIEERFSGFKAQDGVTLPTKYDIRYTQELQSGSTKISEWTLDGQEVSTNVSLDPRNFEVK